MSWSCSSAATFYFDLLTPCKHSLSVFQWSWAKFCLPSSVCSEEMLEIWWFVLVPPKQSPSHWSVATVIAYRWVPPSASVTACDLMTSGWFSFSVDQCAHWELQWCVNYYWELRVTLIKGLCDMWEWLSAWVTPRELWWVLQVCAKSLKWVQKSSKWKSVQCLKVGFSCTQVIGVFQLLMWMNEKF